MVVAITPNLRHLKHKLVDLGYKVVILGEYNYPIDAVVYTHYRPDISYISANNVPDNLRAYGILMINAQNKTIEEINDILKTKVYSLLF